MTCHTGAGSPPEPQVALLPASDRAPPSLVWRAPGPELAINHLGSIAWASSTRSSEEEQEGRTAGARSPVRDDDRADHPRDLARPATRAGIVFQPLGTADFEGILSETEELLRGTAEETGTEVNSSEDEFGYRWLILDDADFEDLVVALNTISVQLQGSGYGDRLLCAVFAFEEKGKPVYFIYNFKRGAYYPFVPAPGRAGARLRARAAPEGPDRRRAALRGGHVALVPALGDPALGRWASTATRSFPAWSTPSAA